jgi:hypothetical protein
VSSVGVCIILLCIVEKGFFVELSKCVLSKSYYVTDQTSYLPENGLQKRKIKGKKDKAFKGEKKLSMDVIYHKKIVLV